MAKLNFNRHDTIVGPILPHLASVGMSGEEVIIATAFYSKRALNYLSIKAASVTLCCRLDITEIDEWILGVIDPEALLSFMRTQQKRGANVSLFVSPHAHAKVYLGSKAVLIGSSNLTMQGFGGGHEIVHRIEDVDIRARAAKALMEYRSILTPLRIDDLDLYVQSNIKNVIKKRKLTPVVDKLPHATRSERKHLGEYRDFLGWLKRQRSGGASEIHARALGKHNLSGHIDRNFHGLRQFIIAYPELLDIFKSVDPDTYKLSKDPRLEAMLSAFVHEHAVDEGGFLVDRWRTYLPIECGGNAARHGGTIGNLNYMVPLVADYLRRTLSKSNRT